MIIRCDSCGKEFERSKGQVNEANRKGWRQACSRKCQGDLKKKVVKKECEWCGSSFEVAMSRSGRRFCKKECSLLFLAKGRKKEPGRCVVCGVSLDKGKSFCSQTCAQKHRYQEYIKRWMEGKETGSNKNKTRSSGCLPSPYVRRWLRETRGNRCEECGWSRAHPVSGIVPLQPHHKDGNGANNRPENLKLLCAACHTLTENWGRRNKRQGMA